MTTQHTPGRLHVNKDVGIYSDKGRLIASVHTPITQHGNADARRLVACWNACDGLTTEHLENIDMLGETLAGRFAAFHASERELMDTRDELLEALKQMVSIVAIHSRATKNNFAWAEMDEARAAIAAATGEQP